MAASGCSEAEPSEPPIGSSPFPKSPSEYSIKSDFDSVEQLPVTSQSPFINPYPSPSMIGALNRQENYAIGIPNDSESSSRSSFDAQQPRELSESSRRFRESRSHERGLSSGESSTDDDEPFDHEGPQSRRPSQSQEQLSLLRPTDAPRGRLANIRRESSCSVDSEISHERLLKATQKVSAQWDELSIEEQERRPDSTSTSNNGRRNSSVSEPITVAIMNNAFLPHSCSPSPTRYEPAKQCYSPSTHTFVRSNIPYSPSPSPTRSPSRNRLMRLRSQSPSPIAGPPRSLKRRMNEMAGNGENGEIKRICGLQYPRGATSPLVQERPFSSFPGGAPIAVDFTQPSTSMLFAQPKRPELLRRISLDSSPSSSRDQEGGETPMEETSEPLLDTSDPFARPFSNESAQTEGNPGSISMASGIDTNPPTPLSCVSGHGDLPSTLTDIENSFTNDVNDVNDSPSSIKDITEPPISDPTIDSSTPEASNHS
ncbi:unnamed protein product, partial [Mesorhabditis belari]|uniref:Uncharacterized protein n=1 Tax=Mesorhabditis belari TaxID=2138241 RepID=A0AAF3EV01_9BILA